MGRTGGRPQIDFVVPTRLRCRAVLVLLCGSACGERRAASPAIGPLTIVEAWARAADSGTTGGAYLTLSNTDSIPVTISAVSSDVTLTASIHETMDMDGMTHMMPRPSLVIDRDSSLHMVPGGVHVMLNDLTRALRVGDSVTLRLTLAGRGAALPVVVHVRSP